MNNSWLSDSKSSGFIYYSLDTTPSKSNPEAEVSDFIALSDNNPSPQASRFNPTNYSSPQTFRRGNPRNFYKRGWKQNSHKSFSPNNSYNHSSPNDSFSYNNTRSRENSCYSNKSRNNSNIKSYFHSSFLENPWKHLEAQLEQRKQNNILEQSSDSADSDIAQENEYKIT